jgi:hypothetical protein
MMIEGGWHWRDIARGCLPVSPGWQAGHLHGRMGEGFLEMQQFLVWHVWNGKACETSEQCPGEAGI